MAKTLRVAPESELGHPIRDLATSRESIVVEVDAAAYTPSPCPAGVAAGDQRASAGRLSLPAPPRALAQGIAASRCLLHLGDDWVDAGDLPVRRDRFDGVPGLVLSMPPRPIL
jgi:hypothetical protein